MKGYKITADKFMDEDQVRRLLRKCEDMAILDMARGRKIWQTRYMVVHLALHSGLRVSELAALKVGDLHLNGKGSYLIVQNGKGGKKRDVYLDKEVVKHLKAYLEVKEKTWRESVGESAPLFCGRSGGHYTTTALHISFKKGVEAAGLPKRFSIHSARHTYATILLARSGNIRFVQKQLGHAALTMTSLYSGVLPEMNSTLANAILGDKV